MDRPTVDVYERIAVEYAAARPLRDTTRLAAFAEAIPPGRLRLDLGCGPGLQLPLLGQPIVAADAAAAMLHEVGRRVPAALRVQCDLEALPFQRGALAGVWTSKAHQHIPAERLPMALAELHHVLEVGGRLDLTVFEGAGAVVSDDDFPGRFFTWWHESDLADLLVGAGFVVEASTLSGAEAHRRIEITATRARTLADTVGPDMRLLCCGLNPSLYAADAGVAFARPGNRFWPALRAAGLAAVDRDPRRLLSEHDIGMTDLVKRATPRADELSPDEYRTGVARIERLCRRLQPRALCLVGLSGWRAAVDARATVGWQPRELAGVAVYVMPSTSGANAHATPPVLAEHLRAAASRPPQSPIHRGR